MAVEEKSQKIEVSKKTLHALTKILKSLGKTKSPLQLKDLLNPSSCIQKMVQQLEKQGIQLTEEGTLQLLIIVAVAGAETLTYPGTLDDWADLLFCFATKLNKEVWGKVPEVEIILTD